MHNPAASFRLGNGCAISCLGFGTWQTPDGDTAVAAVNGMIYSGGSGLRPNHVDF